MSPGLTVETTTSAFGRSVDRCKKPGKKGDHMTAKRRSRNRKTAGEKPVAPRAGVRAKQVEMTIDLEALADKIIERTGVFQEQQARDARVEIFRSDDRLELAGEANGARLHHDLVKGPSIARRPDTANQAMPHPPIDAALAALSEAGGDLHGVINLLEDRLSKLRTKTEGPTTAAPIDPNFPNPGTSGLTFQLADSVREFRAARQRIQRLLADIEL